MLSSATTLRQAFEPFAGSDAIGVIGYVMGGIDGAGGTLEVGRALLDAGICVLEVGVPFSDPTADGPTIRRQSERALTQGATVAICLEQAAALAAHGGQPVVTMGYANSVFNFGVRRYAEALKAGGICGTIIADAPVDEPLGIRSSLASEGRAFIPLATPTSSDDRLKQITAAAGDGGFVYCVARRGVTGARADESESSTATQASALSATVDLLERVKAAAPAVPRAVGFGITSPEHVRNLAPHAEAVVVASAMFDLIDTLPAEERAAQAHRFMASLVAAGAASA